MAKKETLVIAFNVSALQIEESLHWLKAAELYESNVKMMEFSTSQPF